MDNTLDGVGIGSFAVALGDEEVKPQDIPGFDELWRVASDADLATMGCGTFRRMSAPVEGYVVDSVTRTLADAGVPPGEVDRLVIATTDANLRWLGADFAVDVLRAAGLSGCVPVVLSMQQCCASVTALRHTVDQFADPAVRNALLVSVDFTPDDRDRVRPFALFGDAAASCLLGRGRDGLRLLSSAIRVDPAGLAGQDSFASRQQVAQAAYTAAFTEAGTTLADMAMVFPTNLFQPLTVFGSAVLGVQRDRLHFADTLRAYGHCGNSDWMINLVDYQTTVGLRADATYLAQASAPGFFACAVLAGS